jgi:hypothetical protein
MEKKYTDIDLPVPATFTVTSSITETIYWGKIRRYCSRLMILL